MSHWTTCLLFNQSFSLWIPRIPIPPIFHPMCCILHAVCCSPECATSQPCLLSSLFSLLLPLGTLCIAYTPRLLWLPILHLTFVHCLCFGAASELYANAAKYFEWAQNACHFFPYVSASPTSLWFCVAKTVPTCMSACNKETSSSAKAYCWSQQKSCFLPFVSRNLRFM